jgi:hypothetical protein
MTYQELLEDAKAQLERANRYSSGFNAISEAELRIDLIKQARKLTLEEFRITDFTKVKDPQINALQEMIKSILSGGIVVKAYHSEMFPSADPDKVITGGKFTMEWYFNE